eukprot:TRINITY_DN26_c0_g3_i2.p1 TRINITY_DN26_c0_g3~~TRINITY_DN26_c0_g3_i2.p1  ORF type:complete len:329 (+),score=87.31 TRINITY_DN26_c0_g3_i2:73-987(+)
MCIRDRLARGGKRWRPVLCLMITDAFGGKISDVAAVAGLCEIVHNGTLVIDDIQDSSKFRRGKPCVHHIYGIDLGTNASNFAYFLPVQTCILQNPQFTAAQKSAMLNAYFEEMISVHLGQGWDIYWHNLKEIDSFLPNEENYLQMVSHKTGVLPRLGARLTGMALGLPNDTLNKVTRFAQNIGVGFQIQDDILNLVGEDFSTKGFLGEDIHEGKLSLIALHSLRNANEKDRRRLFEILRMRTEDQKFIKEAIDLMKKTNSIQYAADRARVIVEETWRDVEGVLPETEAKKHLAMMKDYLIVRKV